MNRSHDGFTLVEVLVAISVAALLVSLVYGSVRVGQRSAAALGVQAEEAEVMRIGWQFLNDALAQARPAPDPAVPNHQTGFHGEHNKLSFIANMPAYVGIGGLVRISLSGDRSNGAYRLLLTRSRLGQWPATRDSAERAILVDDLDSLNIAYFGTQERSAVPAWYGTWADPRALPNLIRISIKPAAAQAWPVLIARPLSGSEPLRESAPTSDSATAATVLGVMQ